MHQMATADRPAVSPYLLALRKLLRDDPAPLTEFVVGELRVAIHVGADSVFAIVRRARGGGLAIRAAYIPVPFECEAIASETGEAARLRLTSTIGEHIVSFRADRDALERLRIVTDFTPARDIVLPFAPRDLYPLGRGDDPLRAKGNVEASQRGINTGLLYFRIDEPAFGNVLYVQNLTPSNPYFRATGTIPRESVGGAWPELGYALPTPSAKADPKCRCNRAAR